MEETVFCIPEITSNRNWPASHMA